VLRAVYEMDILVNGLFLVGGRDGPERTFSFYGTPPPVERESFLRGGGSVE
jgi:hypothetical protein